MSQRHGRRVPSVIDPNDGPPVDKWVKNNLRIGIARRTRRLQNSMAHTPHPRPDDLARWRTMQGEIERMQAALAAMPPPARSPPSGRWRQTGAHRPADGHATRNPEEPDRA